MRSLKLECPEPELKMMRVRSFDRMPERVVLSEQADHKVRTLQAEGIVDMDRRGVGELAEEEGFGAEAGVGAKHPDALP